ncbi:MAG: permease-like cell division protein FtsX [Ruminococcus sp.]|nr:permease-like cell division protein FtsX [Ruminococcus sp.]
MKGFGYLLKEGFKNVYSNRIMSIASVCVLVSCLVMTGAAALFSLNVLKVVDEVEKNNQTTVFIKKDTDAEKAKADYKTLRANRLNMIGDKIRELDNVESAEFVSQEDGLKQYKSKLGDDLFKLIEDREDVLNDSYIVTFKNAEQYDATVAQIKRINGVESITDRRSFAKKLSDISKFVNIVAICVVTALFIISLFIIANTIRTTMYSRRFEISIMKSVGATNSFVRMPFLVEGVVLGCVSAALSTGVLALLYKVADGLVDKVDLGIEPIPFMSILPVMVIAFVVVGVLVGFFGGFISIRKYLKKEGNEILGW